MKFLTFIAALLLSTKTVRGAGTDDILGIWKTEPSNGVANPILRDHKAQ